MKKLLHISIALTILSAACSSGSNSQAIEKPAYAIDSAAIAVQQPIMARLATALAPHEDDAIHLQMVRAAEMMLGTEYVAGTLDDGDDERVRVYLDRTDCIIFVETIFDLAHAVKQAGADADYSLLCDLVRQSRYRDGICERYSDRIHYTTEWIRQGEARGLMKDITEELGGVDFNDPIDFMSTHRASYRHLADTASAEANHDWEVIAAVEKSLNETPSYYIPEDRIAAIQDQIRSGDIICFMSGTKGLDIAHVSIAYVHDGIVGFIHASQAEGRVIVDPKSISDYTLGRKSSPGIKVIRVL